jgi:long-chain acyl-CoA synthetase
VGEYSTPGNVSISADSNLTDVVFDRAVTDPDAEMFRVKTEGGWQPVRAQEFASQVRAIANGLISSGVHPGDRVALLSKTRYEWTLADYAIWAAGAVTVPIFESSSAKQVSWILSDSEAMAAVVETAAHRSTVDGLRAGLPVLASVWVIDDGGLGQLAAKGGTGPDRVEERRRATRADSLATVIYTSGTTGRPKGCELTHGNFLFDAMTTADGLGEVFDQTSSTLLFLPLAHVFARVIQVGSVIERVTMAHTDDVRNLLPDLAEFRPTFILSVPRVFEKVHTGAKTKAHSHGRLPGRIFDLAESVAISYSQASESGRPPPWLTAAHGLFDRLVYSRLRGALGGRTRWAISGGAPLGARLGHFFHGIGVTVLEGYGLTETTAGATLNLPGAFKIGTVGRPIPGTSVRIAEDGEVQLRGENIFRGYWRNETATKETLKDDGWLATGDIGELDGDGFLRITGRKKELIVTAGGKNVAPAVLEDRIRSHALVSQCMVVGDQRPFIGCLVTIDPDALPSWKREHSKAESAGLEELREDEDLRSSVQQAVDDANRLVSRAEAIRKFLILPVDFTEEGGQLTPTLKLKRNVVAKEFAPEIEALYSS